MKRRLEGEFQNIYTAFNDKIRRYIARYLTDNLDYDLAKLAAELTLPAK